MRNLRIYIDGRSTWIETKDMVKSWHEGRMSSHHWAPTAEDFPRWAYFRPERQIFCTCIFCDSCGVLADWPPYLCQRTRRTQWQPHGGKTLQIFPCTQILSKNTADKYCQDYADKSCESISFTYRESAGLNRCRRWAWEFPGPTSSHIWTCKVRPWAEIQLGDKFSWLGISSYRSTASVGVQV